jgi:hypothetical protein
MIFDFTFKTGLVFGLEYEEVLVVDEDKVGDEGTVFNCIVIHFGILTINLMYL